MSSFLSASSDSEMTQMPLGVQGAWQGGPCPVCGDDMPANVVHCRSCRALLNNELSEDSVEIPEFVPLREINPHKMAQLQGHFVTCPSCREELRISSRYKDVTVSCRFCEHIFPYDLSVEAQAMYSVCPHCEKELRASIKYLGQSVACQFCSGPLMITE